MVTLLNDGNENVPFLNPNEFKDGEEVEFVSPGQRVSDKYGENRLQMDVRFSSGEIRRLTVNKTSQKNLVSVYGPETESWPSRKARITKTNMLIAGNWKQVIILYPVE